jgi:hypothetical protein
MFSAEVVSAVRTTKGKKRFLPALLTFHVLRAPFMLKKTKPFICFPSKIDRWTAEGFCQILKTGNPENKSYQQNQSARGELRIV